MGIFISALLVVDTFFASYYMGFHSRTVSVVDPSLPHSVQAPAAVAPAKKEQAKSAPAKAPLVKTATIKTPVTKTAAAKITTKKTSALTVKKTTAKTTPSKPAIKP